MPPCSRGATADGQDVLHHRPSAFFLIHLMTTVLDYQLKTACPSCGGKVKSNGMDTWCCNAPCEWGEKRLPLSVAGPEVGAENPIGGLPRGAASRLPGCSCKGHKDMSWLAGGHGAELVKPPKQGVGKAKLKELRAKYKADSQMDKGMVGDALQSAGRFLARKWEQLENRYGRRAALTMAIAGLATFPIPGNLTAIIGIAEGIRGLHGYFSSGKAIRPPHLKFSGYFRKKSIEKFRSPMSRYDFIISLWRGRDAKQEIFGVIGGSREEAVAFAQSNIGMGGRWTVKRPLAPSPHLGPSYAGGWAEIASGP